MNLQRSRTPMRTFLLGIVIVRLATFCAPALAQTNEASRYDSLNAFVGTWTAKTPGANTPFLVLKVRASNGELAGTMSHFKLRVIGHGTITGTPLLGESPVAHLTIGQADFFFVWGEPPLGGDEAKFVLEGTEKAMLVIMVSGDLRKLHSSSARHSLRL
jgi:hypothetical protein